MATRNAGPSEKMIHLYRTWAEGGAGLLVTGNVMIDRNALGEPKNVVLDEASDMSMFERWAEAGKTNNTQLWMQINHPGKQSPKMLCEHPVAPSAIPLGSGLEGIFNPPRELAEAEILDIIERFAWVAKMAKKLGFTGVQVHGAHGYLVSQFLSPHHNRRTDKWGGSLGNRMRFAREVYRAIRAQVGDDFPIGMKLNSADFQKGGFSEGDSVRVMATLQDDGVDLIEISGGTLENTAMMGGVVKASTRKREAYFLDYAEEAQKVLTIPLVVTGGFRSASAMNDALESAAADMIGIARPLAVDPMVAIKLVRDGDYSMELKEVTTGVPKLDWMTMLSATWY